MRSHGGVNVMLDYADINATHSNEYMKAVFEELFEHISFEGPLANKIINSFDKCYMFNPITQGHELIAGTLMSGHRATTFINSTLNFAYIFASEPNIVNMKSMHVGDDIYITAQGYYDAYELLYKCEHKGLAMNPMKQSVGQYTAEFLRIAYREHHCIGYLMRSVAAVVAGNWVNEIKLSKKEGLDTVQNAAWTLGNRCGDSTIGLLLKHSLKRMARIGGRVADGLLTGTISKDGTPVRWTGADTYTVTVKFDETKVVRQLDDMIRYCPATATTDYLSYHATPQEIYAVQALKLNLRNEMARSSYEKSIKPRLVVEETEVDPVIKSKKMHIRGRYLLDEAWNLKEDKGLLSGQPLMELCKNALNDNPVVLSDVLVSLTGGVYYSGEEAKRMAWGVDYPTGCAIGGRLAWSDACRIASKTNGELILVDYNCYA
jgi:hypothetical protein